MQVGDERFHETTLENGVRVLSEEVPGVRSVSAGVWVRRGSAHEPAEHLGCSHLLEHMAFKGTRRRTARELALALEGLGGSLDAWTAREHTAFEARVLDADLPEALDVLADLTLEPLLRDQDLALERRVVLEEIAEVEDAPDDLVFELHGARLWGDHPYGRPILGTAASVSGMPGAVLRELHARAYTGRGLVVGAAGRVDHGELVERARSLFGGIEAGEAPPGPPPAPGPASGADLQVERASAQSHVVFGGRAPAHDHPDRYPVVLLATALGGGMGSRLFQRVREELGLCYTVFTWHSFWGAGGAAGGYLATSPATAQDAVATVLEELARVAREGLPEEEVAWTRRQLEGQVMLSLESTGARLHRLVTAALHDEPFLGLDEILGRIRSISTDDVARVAEAWFDPARQLVLRLGPV